jgi:hypothetical protein
MRRALRNSGLAIGLLATAGVVVYASRTLHKADLGLFLTPRGMAGVGVAALAYTLIIPLSAIAWRRLLAGMECQQPWGQLFTIMGITQLAKYLPGNVGQHIGRAAMSLGRGIPLAVYLPSVMIEAVLASMAAALVGMACAGAVAPDLALSNFAISPANARLLVILVALAVLACLYLAPRLLERISATKYVSKRVLTLPDTRAIRYALFIYIGNYILVGLGITVMALVMTEVPASNWLLLTGSFALAWVVGFFTPGAPAGLGVREGVMLALLQFKLAHTDALLVVMGLRLATTAGDILCFAVAFFGHATARMTRTPPPVSR